MRAILFPLFYFATFLPQKSRRLSTFCHFSDIEREQNRGEKWIQIIGEGYI